MYVFVIGSNKYLKDGGKHSTKSSGQMNGTGESTKSSTTDDKTSGNGAIVSAGDSNTMRTFTDKYSDSTAAVYEEWNVIKKNKFGIKQDRVFGIDFHCIYNAKRSAHREVKVSERSNVRLAQRDIKDIIRFERAEDDLTKKTFRITWQEDNVQYNIEYACVSERDCTQILNKLTYIRNKRNHG